MNPFEYDNDNDNDNNTVQNTKESVVNIWIVTTGRKKNTYISGWNVTEAELKEHLKAIKKKNGCNGTVKTIQNESTNEDEITLQLQGEHVDYVRDYMIQQGVDEDNIHVKG